MNGASSYARLPRRSPAQVTCLPRLMRRACDQSIDCHGAKATARVLDYLLRFKGTLPFVRRCCAGFRAPERGMPCLPTRSPCQQRGSKRARSHTALAQKRTSPPMDTPATFDHKHTTKGVGIGMIEGRVDDPTVD
jgi:hypothetical protein